MLSDYNRVLAALSKFYNAESPVFESMERIKTILREVTPSASPNKQSMSASQIADEIEAYAKGVEALGGKTLFTHSAERWCRQLHAL